MRTAVPVMVLLVLVGCSSFDLTARERYEELRAQSGSLGVSYNVTVNSGGLNDESVRAAWHDSTFKTVVTPSSDARRRVVKSSVNNRTVLCRTDYGGVVYNCDRAEDILGGKGSYHDLIGVALQPNVSSLSYTGRQRRIGRTCHGFIGELDASAEPLAGAQRRIRSKFCLDDRTGRPLLINVQRAQLAVDGSVEWSTVVSMEATDSGRVDREDVLPPLPFSVKRSYASYGEDEAHVVVEALSPFNASLDIGNLSAGTVTVDLDAGETSHVVLPVSDASRLRVDNDLVEGSSAIIPVCVGDVCHKVGAKDRCITKSGDPVACRESPRCDYDNGVCEKQPESCAGLDKRICEESKTRGGQSCQWTNRGCKAESAGQAPPRQY